MIDFPNKRYQIIYADPPWRYKFSKTAARAIEKHYPTMPIEDIKALPVKDISDNDCCLFLWATFPKLIEAISVLESWGFEYKTTAFVWVKGNKNYNPDQISFMQKSNSDFFWGLGHWTRSNVEICLFGTKGKPKKKSSSVHQVIYSPIRKHSQKPNEARKRIVDLLGDISRIELFARNKTKGWDVWGNEIKQSTQLK